MWESVREEFQAQRGAPKTRKSASPAHFRGYPRHSLLQTLPRGPGVHAPTCPLFQKYMERARAMNGVYILWLNIRMHSKVMKSNLRYYIRIERNSSSGLSGHALPGRQLGALHDQQGWRLRSAQAFLSWVCVESQALQLLAQWKNKGTLVKETVTARFHEFRMKAAAGIRNIEEGVRFEQVDEEQANDPLSYIMEVPAVLKQDAPAEDNGGAGRRRSIPRGRPRRAHCGSRPHVATTSATWL
eukprot:g8434.t1